jgi:hypothetical protein
MIEMIGSQRMISSTHARAAPLQRFEAARIAVASVGGTLR